MAKATAQEFYADLKSLAAAEGRLPEQMLILPGLSPMIAATEAEAARLAREINELTDPEVGRKRLSGRFGGYDFSDLPLDRPLYPADFPDPASVEAARSRTEVIVNLVKRDQPTLRQLLGYLAGARGHFVTAGTPEQIAALIEDWFNDGAADGFNVMPPLLPAQLDAFSTEVIPICSGAGCSAPNTSGQRCMSITVCPGRRASLMIRTGRPSFATTPPAYDRLAVQHLLSRIICRLFRCGLDQSGARRVSDGLSIV